jgi:hypothetical protein
MRRFAWIRRGNLPLHYELLCNGSPLGSLCWVQGSRSTAVAEMAGGVLVFRREGLLLRRVVIENLREEPIAKISLNPVTRTGELRQPDGTRYSFRIKGTLQWSDAAGNPLARIDDATGIGGIGTVTETSSIGKALPLTLVFAGWYLRITMRRDRAAGSIPIAQDTLVRKPLGAH